MDERKLDLSYFSEDEFKRITNGLDKMKTKTCSRYFGYVDRHDMKNLAKAFGGSYIGPVGTLIIRTTILVGGYFAFCHYIDSKSKKLEEESVTEEK